MHAAEEDVWRRTDAVWREQRSQHEAKVRSEEAETRERHAARPSQQGRPCLLVRTAGSTAPLPAAALSSCRGGMSGWTGSAKACRTTQAPHRHFPFACAIHAWTCVAYAYQCATNRACSARRPSADAVPTTTASGARTPIQGGAALLPTRDPAAIPATSAGLSVIAVDLWHAVRSTSASRVAH